MADLFYVRTFTRRVGYEFVGYIAPDGSPTLVLVDDSPLALPRAEADEVAAYLRDCPGVVSVGLLRADEPSPL